MRSRAGSVLLLALVLGLSLPATLAQAQAPRIDIVLRWEPAVPEKAGVNGFVLSYAWSTPHSAEEFADFFPREALGGRRDACGYEVVDGLELALDQPVRWLGAEAMPDPENLILDPPSVNALLQGTGSEATTATVRVRDTAADQSILFDGRPVQSGYLTLYTDDATNVTWTLTLKVDCYCSYRTREGVDVGRLTNADLREKPTVAVVHGELIPTLVANDDASWSVLKGEYRRR